MAFFSLLVGDPEVIMPQYDPGTDGDVERVLCSKLGNFNALINMGKDLRADAIYFIAKYKRIIFFLLRDKAIQ